MSRKRKVKEMPLWWKKKLDEPKPARETKTKQTKDAKKKYKRDSITWTGDPAFLTKNSGDQLLSTEDLEYHEKHGTLPPDWKPSSDPTKEEVQEKRGVFGFKSKRRK